MPGSQPHDRAPPSGVPENIDGFYRLLHPLLEHRGNRRRVGQSFTLANRLHGVDDSLGDLILGQITTVIANGLNLTGQFKTGRRETLGCFFNDLANCRGINISPMDDAEIFFVNATGGIAAQGNILE